MNFQIKGELKKVFAEQQVTDKFKKREFVVETKDQYPQVIKFQLSQDRCGLIESYDIGDDITVSFDIQGKEFVKGTEVFYFTTLNAWKLSSDAAPQGASDKPMTKVNDLEEPLIIPLNANNKPYAVDDDLPF